jgi:hypothetical protein
MEVDRPETEGCVESDDDIDDINEKKEQEEPAMATEEDETGPSNDISRQVVRSTPCPPEWDSTSRPGHTNATMPSLDPFPSFP